MGENKHFEPMYACLGCTSHPGEKKNTTQKNRKNGRFWEEIENRKIAADATGSTHRPLDSKLKLSRGRLSSPKNGFGFFFASG